MTQLPGVNSNMTSNQRWSQPSHTDEEFSLSAVESGGRTRKGESELTNPAYILNLSKEAREMLRKQRSAK